MSFVLIGRKELFSFSDRYSGRRLKDYSGLADGEVLCLLFNRIFPRHAIHPASAHTHTASQRAQLNWEALFRRFAAFHIPIRFLDPMALMVNNAEKGFSTLVLFYFLFHLSKRTDFTAEFALDIAEELTTYLQSMDSVASLLLGEALDWESLPEALGSSIRGLPSFHVPPVRQTALEEEAARLCRTIMNPNGGSKSTLGPRKAKRAAATAFPHTDQSEGPSLFRSTPPASVDTTLQPHAPPSTSSHDASVVVDVKSTVVNISASASSCGSDISIVQLSEGSSLHSSPVRHLPQSSDTPPRQQPQTVEARECEVEELRKHNAVLTLTAHTQDAKIAAAHRCDSHLRKDDQRLMERLGTEEIGKAEAPQTTKPLYPLTDDTESCVALSSEAAALLDDVVDTETGEVVDVRQRASLLHGLLLKHLPSSAARGEAQSWLWSIAAAYHTIETRLVTAVTIIDVLHDRLESGVDAVALLEHSRSHLQATHEENLQRLHEEEHRLREEIRRMHEGHRRAMTLAGAREATWKRLCSSLRDAEVASASLLDGTASVAAESVFANREQHYHDIKLFTEELLTPHAQVEEPGAADPPSTAGYPCRSMQMLLKELQSDRDHWRSAVTLRQQSDCALPTLAAGDAANIIRHHVDQQLEYEVDALRPYRKKFTLRSPHMLSRPRSLVSSRDSSLSSNDHRDVRTTDDGPLERTSPYEKVLTALLSEASSPFDGLGPYSPAQP